jgi:hypothetical protein
VAYIVDDIADIYFLLKTVTQIIQTYLKLNNTRGMCHRKNREKIFKRLIFTHLLIKALVVSEEKTSQK